MDEEQVVGVRRRRTLAEVEQLVAEYEASGLCRSEFCQTHGLSLATLGRHLRRRQRNGAAQGGEWLAVELRGPNLAAGSRPADSGLAVVLSSGRRIEIGREFDANALRQVIRSLEQI
jgi:hypothetical protein